MTVEFFGKLNPKRLSSLTEDFNGEQAQYLADEARYKKYKTNKQSVADLLARNQIMPASELLRIREEQAQAQKAFEESVKNEESHRKSKYPNEVGSITPIYSREPFED